MTKHSIKSPFVRTLSLSPQELEEILMLIKLVPMTTIEETAAVLKYVKRLSEFLNGK